MNEPEQRVRDYYGNLSLSQERLNLLLKATANSEASRAEQLPGKPAIFSAWRSSLRSLLPGLPAHAWLPAGLVVGLFIMASLWVVSGSESELSKRTLGEVAMNHTTRLEPEFHGTSLAMLDDSMHQLPFNLTLPKSLDSTYDLIGSRYCSLGGVLAAHVKLQDKQSGKTMSLFVTKNAAELKEIQPRQKKLEGVNVEIWREGGLLFALAQRS